MFFIVFAYQIMAIVAGWRFFELTHDMLALGLVGMAEVFPYFCCTLFAGYAVRGGAEFLTLFRMCDGVSGRGQCY
ncbi:MAG: hypothetical protein ACU83V_01215 [Gammaproteobacteria bacterium]